MIFVAFGFERVEVRTLEEQAAEPARSSDRVAARLRALLGSRYGLFVRYFVPLMLVVAVFVPLRHALEEVVWQVRVHGEAQTLVDRLAPPRGSVHSTISVASHRVTVRLVILGDSARAKRIERDLRAGIAKSTDVPDHRRRGRARPGGPRQDCRRAPDGRARQSAASYVSGSRLATTHRTRRPRERLAPARRGSAPLLGSANR